MVDEETKTDIWGSECTQYVVSQILVTFPKHIPGNKFDKSFRTESNRNILEKFFREQDVKLILIPETLKLADSMPSKLPRTKCLALLKTADFLSKSNIYHSVFSIELGGNSPFDQLEILSKSVFAPIIQNPMNQRRFGDVTYRELNESLHSFLSSMTILCGEVKGETVLPLPVIEDYDNGLKKTQNPIPVYESSILTWTKQINNILKRDPDILFKNGLHPTPDKELLFWKAKATSLASVYEQLQSEEICRILYSLDQANSTYCLPFAEICKDVRSALMEASENVALLSTCEDCFGNLINVYSNVSKLKTVFRPILHAIFLLWTNSNYYSKEFRMVNLLKEICNSLIEQSLHHISGEQIFALVDNDEASSALKDLEIVTTICNKFKQAYCDFKDRVSIQCPGNPIKVQNTIVFHRLDCFLDRCRDIIDMLKTHIQFTKLSKVEIGSTKGKFLTESVHRIHDDFEKSFTLIQNAEFDVLNIEEGDFDRCYEKYRKSVKDLERRVASVICISLDDCATIHSKVRLLDSFDVNLLDRMIIKDELESKHADLIKVYCDELRSIKECFLSNKDNPPQNHCKNLPSVANSIAWCRGLAHRIQTPLTKLNHLDKNIVLREDAIEMKRMQSQLLCLLEQYETEKVTEWSYNIESTCDQKLHLNLLQRCNDTKELSTNFDATLVCFLRETKYLLLLGIDVPNTALRIYQSSDKFRGWIGNLDLVSDVYNAVMRKLLPV